MRVSRTSFASLPALIAVVLIATAGFAQVIKEETVSEAVTGTIKELGVAETLLVEEEDGRQHLFATDANTTIMSGGKKLSYGDLEVGWHVAVDADTREDVAMATYVQVVDTP